MRPLVRWGLVALIVVLIGVFPFVLYRAVYGHAKRLREVTPGLVYRSGQMTAEGIADAVQRLGIRTVLNLQDDNQDPALPISFLNRATVKETALCRELGVRYVCISPDLISRRSIPEKRPAAIEQFLALMDDPDTYPVLIHCKAGLHRTGCMVAIYRMEYEGWSLGDAIREVKDNGFGETACTAYNDYVTQYILTYKPRVMKQWARERY